MGQFSDDGRWWWDGATWIETAHIVLPQLPSTEFEQSGKLEDARDRMRERDWLHWVVGTTLPALWLGARFLAIQERVLGDYRLWTLEQLSLATAFLLGPDEPMLAGETNMSGTHVWVTRDLGVAVTAAHVLIFRIDNLNGQPRWVTLAARPTDVKMELHGGPFRFRPWIFVTQGRRRWVIGGHRKVFQAEPVLQAWRQAAGAVHPA